MSWKKRKLTTLNKFKLVQGASLKLFPFISSFLSKNLRIVLTESIETAGVSKHTIYINPVFWESLSEQDALFVIIHEALHIALFDHVRFESIPNDDRHQQVWNLAADAVNNVIVGDALKYMMKNCVTYYSLGNMLQKRIPDDVMGHKERLYKWLLDNLPKDNSSSSNSGKCSCGSSLSRDLIDDKKSDELDKNGKELFKGSKYDEFREAAKNKQDYQEKVRAEVSKSYTAAKMIGTIPASLDKIITDLLGSKVDWKTLLRKRVRSYLSKFIVSTWRKPSRRMPYVLPGYNKYSIPDIWAVIDTSGSISGKELEQFMSEIYEASRVTQSKMNIVFFDADAYGPYNIKKPNDVMKIKPIGGGGTVIEPALNITLPRMKKNDIMLILTDGYIWSKESEYKLQDIKDRLWIVTTGTSPYKSLEDRTIFIEDL